MSSKLLTARWKVLRERFSNGGTDSRKGTGSASEVGDPGPNAGDDAGGFGREVGLKLGVGGDWGEGVARGGGGEEGGEGENRGGEVPVEESVVGERREGWRELSGIAGLAWSAGRGFDLVEEVEEEARRTGGGGGGAEDGDGGLEGVEDDAEGLVEVGEHGIDLVRALRLAFGGGGVEDCRETFRARLEKKTEGGGKGRVLEHDDGGEGLRGGLKAGS